MRAFEVLRKLYTPPIGSIWKAPNKIWKNSFAKNKSSISFHPALVVKINKDKISSIVVPGTSLKQKGNCVFILNLKDDWKVSHFLLRLWMRYNIDDLITLERGWGKGEEKIDELNEHQLELLKNQISNCDAIKYIK